VDFFGVIKKIEKALNILNSAMLVTFINAKILGAL
jgi:hypothetical protein